VCVCVRGSHHANLRVCAGVLVCEDFSKRPSLFVCMCVGVECVCICVLVFLSIYLSTRRRQNMHVFLPYPGYIWHVAFIKRKTATGIVFVTAQGLI
jgi:hypothetical protein